MNETHRTLDLLELVLQWGKQRLIIRPHDYMAANYDV